MFGSYIPVIIYLTIKYNEAIIIFHGLFPLNRKVDNG